MEKREYQVCSNCVMDTSDSVIKLDKNGVCDYCSNFYNNKPYDYIIIGLGRGVDIPAKYTYSIVNVETTHMATTMWANEAFTPHMPDVYFEVV